ncbi:MAG: signal peptidase I [Firmicutes bacterium]|nr:signal peptidase I [Bacillota bacterium]
MENAINSKSKLKVAGNVIFWVVLGLVLIYSVLALFSDQDKNSSTFLGVSVLSVQSNSMSPTFDEGDLIFIDTTFNVDDLLENDVISYRMTLVTPDGPVDIYNTHTIKEINEIGGIKWFTTHGDNNPEDQLEIVFEGDIIGVWNGKVWSNLGSFTDGLVSFLKSGTGFLLFIVLPCFAFLVYEIIRFVKVVSDYNVQKALGSRVQMQEDALAMARAQLEAETKVKIKPKEKKEEEPTE